MSSFDMFRDFQSYYDINSIVDIDKLLASRLR